jgi:type IV secretory pathway VirB10-like protein
MNIPPTIKVEQGTEIRIFLARDLYFPRAPGEQELRP